jgi:glycolate oxidase iron-sulfur subunit
MLRAIPGITMVDLKEADWCCGSAGIYNITNQEMAAELLERKMQNIIATGTDIIATGNPGCMMQIAMGARERGLPLTVMHPVQLLDEAYAAAGRYTVPAPVDNARQWQQAERLLAGVSLVALLSALLWRRRRR